MSLVGDRIKHVRDAQLLLTQRELADKLGVDPQAISRWERGTVEPRMRNLRGLAELAGRPLSWFFAENGPEPTKEET